MLSRLPTIVKSELPVGNMIYSLQIDTLPVTSTEIHTETLKGKILVNVLSHVQSGKWPDKINDSIKPHYNKQNELTIEDGVILWGSTMNFFIFLVFELETLKKSVFCKCVLLKRCS